MTPDDSDDESSTPPRDPETGQFLPKDERPDRKSESVDDGVTESDESLSDHSGPTNTESEPTTTMADDTATADEMEDESNTPETEDEQVIDETEDEQTTSEAEQPAQHARDPGTDPVDARAATRSPPGRRSGTVFVPNPNGYPRPPTTYLPVQPWLRLPSRPPEYETVSIPPGPPPSGR